VSVVQIRLNELGEYSLLYGLNVRVTLVAFRQAKGIYLFSHRALSGSGTHTVSLPAGKMAVA